MSRITVTFRCAGAGRSVIFYVVAFFFCGGRQVFQFVFVVLQANLVARSCKAPYVGLLATPITTDPSTLTTCSFLGVKKKKAEQRNLWSKLRKEECQSALQEEVRQAIGGHKELSVDWIVTGRRVLGMSSGRTGENKTWWCRKNIQRKKLAQKKWDIVRTQESKQDDKDMQRRAKAKVRKGKKKKKAYDDMYVRLYRKKSEKDRCRFARQID